MANSYGVYLTHSEKDVENSFKVISFREELSFEQALQLANSLYLSTDNGRIMVSVREKDANVPIAVFHKRDSD